MALFVPSTATGAGRRPPPATHDFYIGEGWAERGTDVGQARERAKTRAMGDLARNVRVSIRSALIDTCGQNAGKPQQFLESKISAYAELLSVQLDREEFVFNRPRRGDISCRVAIDRARYDQKLRRELTEKKNKALREAVAARQALSQGRPAEALRALRLLKDLAERDFPGLPLESDLDGDGRIEDVWIWGEQQRREIAAGFRLMVSPKEIIYDEKGQYSEGVTARLSWIKDDGSPPSPPRDLRLDGFLLRTRWAHRPGAGGTDVLTDQRGRAVFRPEVDLFVHESTLLTEWITGETPALLAETRFHQRRRAVLWVGGDPPDVRNAIETETLAHLKKFPWDVTTTNDFAEADSRIVVNIRTDTTRHPEGDLYRTVITLTGKIYSGPERRWIFQGPILTGEGYGATPSDAARAAAVQLTDRLGSWVEQQAKDLAY